MKNQCISLATLGTAPMHTENILWIAVFAHAYPALGTTGLSALKRPFCDSHCV